MNSNNNITVVGVDLGSSAAKIAAVLKGGVQIITNQANFRETPNVVGFGQKQRLIGQAGQVKIKSNHSNTVTSPSRFLGFNRPCPYLDQELKLCPAKANKIENEQSGLRFNIMYGRQKQLFNAQQLVASYLTQIQKIVAQTNNLLNKNLVISVPSFFTQHERQALMDAVQICQKKMNNEYSTQLVNDQIGVSIDYGYQKRNQLSQNTQDAKKVLFIDFGHSIANVFVTAFNKQNMRIMAHKFDRQLGCKFLDKELLSFYAQKFDQAHPNMELKLLQSKKAVLKLLQNIGKQRKILSGIYQHDLNIQCILEDEDIYYTMRREQYEKICNPLLERFRKFLTDYFKELKQKGIRYDLIQLVGGGTRIPAILNIISEVFGQQPSRTVNSNECVARGAALISAMNSSIFRVQPYNYFSISPYNIQLKVDNQKIGKNLIQIDQLLLAEKTVQFEVDQSIIKFTLSAEYESIEQGLQTRVFECEVTVYKTSKKPAQNSSRMKQQSDQNKVNKLKLSFNISQNGIIFFDRIVSQSQSCTVKVGKINTFPRFAPVELDEMVQKQKQMALQDVKIKQFYEMKNQYESTIYKQKRNLQQFFNSNKEFLSQAKANQINFLMEGEQKWLNDNTQLSNDFVLQEFSKRTQILNKKVGQMLSSVNQLRQGHDLVNAGVQKLVSLLNQIISKRSKDDYPSQVNRAGEWVNQILQKQNNEPKSNPPVVTIQQIQQVYQRIVQSINQFDQQCQTNFRNNWQYQQPTQNQAPRYTRPQTTFIPQNSYLTKPSQKEDNIPRTRTSRNKQYNNSNPFGSFFGGTGFL